MLIKSQQYSADSSKNFSVYTKLVNYLNSNIALIISLSVYTICAWIIGTHHEPCADEAQAWLIARDENLWNILFVMPRYEGAPTLWHVILHFLQTIGLKYQYFFTVPICFNICATILMFKKSPFHPLVKIFLPFTYFIFYQYGIIARHYSLLFFAFAVIAILFPKRRDNPFRYVTALLITAFISSHSYAVAAMLWICFGCEELSIKPRQWFSRQMIALYATIPFAVFIAFNNLPTSDSMSVNDVHTLNSNILNGLICHIANSFTTNVYYNISLVQVITTITFMFLLYTNYRQKTWIKKLYPILIYGSIFLFMTYFYSHFHHSGLPFLITVFLMWIHPLDWNKFNTTSKAIIVMAIISVFICQIFWSYKSASYEIHHAYNAGKEVAISLKELFNKYPDLKIQAYGFNTVSISPYFDKCPFYKSHYRYGHWDWQAHNHDNGQTLISDEADATIIWSYGYPEEYDNYIVIHKFKAWQYLKNTELKNRDHDGTEYLLVTKNEDIARKLRADLQCISPKNFGSAHF